MQTTLTLVVVLVPIPKSGDLQDCNNYRNVSLICHASQVLLHMILNQLRQYSVVMDDFKISKLDRFRFDFLKKI